MSEPAAQLALLADPTRRQLVDQLGPDGATATTLAAVLPVSRQAVVKHLQSMTAAGLLTRQKAGRDVVYRLAPEALEGITGWFEALGRQWDDRLGALKRAAESSADGDAPANGVPPSGPGDTIWFEIWVDDLDRAQRFYSSLFGWSFEPFAEYDLENYWLIRHDSERGVDGAMVKRRPGERQSQPRAEGERSTIVYVRVDDLERAVSTAEAQGGVALERAKAIGPVDGTFSIVADPEGNCIGLWAP